jgi:hypothetical protein
MPEQRSADHIIYKKKAALQFTLKAGEAIPISGGNGNYTGTKKGCLFVVAAESIGDKSYNWKNKVTISLSEHEISKLIRALKGLEDANFYHDKYMGNPDKQGQEIKKMTVSLPRDENGKPTSEVIWVNLAGRFHGEERKIPGVSVDKNEALGLVVLLERAIPRILGW